MCLVAWYFLVCYRIPWYFVVVCGNFWYCLVVRGIARYCVVTCVFFGIARHEQILVYIFGILW